MKIKILFHIILQVLILVHPRAPSAAQLSTRMTGSTEEPFTTTRHRGSVPGPHASGEPWPSTQWMTEADSFHTSRLPAPPGHWNRWAKVWLTCIEQALEPSAILRQPSLLCFDERDLMHGWPPIFWSSHTCSSLYFGGFEAHAFIVAGLPPLAVRQRPPCTNIREPRGTGTGGGGGGHSPHVALHSSRA